MLVELSPMLSPYSRYSYWPWGLPRPRIRRAREPARNSKIIWCRDDPSKSTTVLALIPTFLAILTFLGTAGGGRAQYYEIWNEPNIDYWNPAPSPEEYGRLFKAVAPAIRAADPSAKIIFGGLAGADRKFAKRALDACACGEGIDVFAYHIYPDYGQNLNPEAMDDERHTSESPKALRDMVRNYPGIRKDLVFWNDEFNSIPSWEGSDESVQVKYIPRGLIADRAAGVRTFVWLMVGATDGNESDDFGILHGLMLRPEDFIPRPVFTALQNTTTLFSDTKFDPSIEIRSDDAASSSPSLVGYGF